MARGSGKPSWAFTYVLVGILAVILGFLWGSLRGHPRSGTSIEPILRLTDLRWDGWSGNAVLRLVITNGTSVDWTFPVRIPKPGAVPIPELYRCDQIGNAGSFRPLLQPSSLGAPVKQFRLRVGQSVPLEFSGPFDPAVKEVGVWADEGTAADHLRESVNRLLEKGRIPCRVNTRPTMHLLHTTIPSDPIPVNPIAPFLLN